MLIQIHDYVLQNLQASKGRWPKVCEATKISMNTLVKIANGTRIDPQVTNLQKLANYFHGLTPAQRRRMLR